MRDDRRSPAEDGEPRHGEDREGDGHVQAAAERSPPGLEHGREDTRYVPPRAPPARAVVRRAPDRSLRARAVRLLPAADAPLRRPLHGADAARTHRHRDAPGGRARGLHRAGDRRRPLGHGGGVAAGGRRLAHPDPRRAAPARAQAPPAAVPRGADGRVRRGDARGGPARGERVAARAVPAARRDARHLPRGGHARGLRRRRPRARAQPRAGHPRVARRADADHHALQVAAARLRRSRPLGAIPPPAARAGRAGPRRDRGAARAPESAGTTSSRRCSRPATTTAPG